MPEIETSSIESSVGPSSSDKLQFSNTDETKSLYTFESLLQPPPEDVRPSPPASSVPEVVQTKKETQEIVPCATKDEVLQRIENMNPTPMSLNKGKWPNTPLFSAISRMSKNILKNVKSLSHVGFFTVFRAETFANTERRLRRYQLDVMATEQAEPKISYQLLCLWASSLLSLNRVFEMWTESKVSAKLGEGKPHFDALRKVLDKESLEFAGDMQYACLRCANVALTLTDGPFKALLQVDILELDGIALDLRNKKKPVREPSDSKRRGSFGKTKEEIKEEVKVEPDVDSENESDEGEKEKNKKRKKKQPFDIDVGAFAPAGELFRILAHPPLDI